MTSTVTSRVALTCLLLPITLASPGACAGEASAEVRALYDTGIAHKRAKEYESAIAELLKAVAQCPEYPEAHWALAWTYIAVGKTAEAVQAFQRVVELRPGSPEGEAAKAAIERMGGVSAPPGGDGAAPDAATGPEVFVKEGDTLFHCDHNCKRISTKLMGAARRPYASPLAAAREGFAPCPDCKPVPDGMMPAVRDALAQRERELRQVKPVTCDRFELHAEWVRSPDLLAPNRALLLSVETDLPSDAQVTLSVTREYRYKDGSGVASQPYFAQTQTVATWVTPRELVLDEGAWDDALGREIESFVRLNLAAGYDLLSTQLESIEPRIHVSAVFPLRQESPRFAEGNRNVKGRAMQSLSLHQPLLARLLSLRDCFPTEMAGELREVEHVLGRGDVYVAESEVVLQCPYVGRWWWLGR